MALRGFPLFLSIFDGDVIKSEGLWGGLQKMLYICEVVGSVSIVYKEEGGILLEQMKKGGDSWNK